MLDYLKAERQRDGRPSTQADKDRIAQLDAAAAKDRKRQRRVDHEKYDVLYYERLEMKSRPSQYAGHELIERDPKEAAQVAVKAMEEARKTAQENKAWKAKRRKTLQ